MDALSMKDCGLISFGHKAPDRSQGEASSRPGRSLGFFLCARDDASTNPQIGGPGSAPLFDMLNGSAAS